MPLRQAKWRAGFLVLLGAGILAAAGSADAQRSRVAYPNCTAVRAAGAAPIRRGEPGYAAHLDRDGDGIACELRRGNGGGRSSRSSRRRR